MEPSPELQMVEGIKGKLKEIGNVSKGAQSTYIAFPLYWLSQNN
jgi:hypothetical protein